MIRKLMIAALALFAASCGPTNSAQHPAVQSQGANISDGVTLQTVWTDDNLGANCALYQIERKAGLGGFYAVVLCKSFSGQYPLTVTSVE